MKIISINAWTIGSTGRIMLECAKAARNTGDEVHVFSKAWIGQDYEGILNHHVIGNYFCNRVHVRLARYSGLHGCFSLLSTLKMLREIDRIQPDLIHLHNLHGWFLNLPLLFLYIKKKHTRVIWTLHDCWSFTGHCPHFETEKCSKWKTGCYACPRYREYPASNVDRSHFLWKMKKWCFTGIHNMVIVTPSEWLANLVKQSYLQAYPVKVIPNGIDHSIFIPRQSDFKQKHGIEGRFMVLGVAFDWGYKKGLDVFADLAMKMDERFAIVIVGVDAEIEAQLDGRIIAIRRTNCMEELAEIYSAADVFLNPTREDTFPTVNIEALACGTPVITFPTGGSSEIIDETCGIVTKAATSDAILEAVQHMRTHVDRYTEAACCNRAKRFDQNVCYDAYVALYEEEVKNVGKNEYT